MELKFSFNSILLLFFISIRFGPYYFDYYFFFIIFLIVFDPYSFS